MYTYNGLWVSSSLLHTPTNIMQYNSLHGVFFPSYFTLKQSLEVSVRIKHLQDMVKDTTYIQQTTLPVPLTIEKILA